MKGFPDLPPIWLLAAMGLAWTLAWAFPGLTTTAPALRLVGGGIAVAGLALIVWSALWFRRKRTTIEPHHAPTRLIVEGPYQLSRNPIYLGMGAILTGQIIWFGAWLAVLLIPLFLSVIVARFIRVEEAALTETFGAEATAYLAATRRWL